MVKDAIVYILIALVGSALFLSSEILEEKNYEFDKEIAKYERLIKKMRNVSKINKKLFEKIEKNKIVILDKERAEAKLIDTFDKYKDYYKLKIDKYLSSKNKLMLSVNIDTILENFSDTKKFADFFEKNSLNGLFLVNKTLEYNEGSLKSEINLIIPYMEK